VLQRWQIVDPVTITPEQTIADALEVMQRYKISGVPVTKNKKLVGILTKSSAILQILRFPAKFNGVGSIDDRGSLNGE
jgi:CBS domain-containing protein